MSKDEVIEKIRKLLRMKRGGTPAEVETALALAAELARKHGVNLGSVDPDVEPESEVITHQEDVLKSRLPLEARLAGAILVHFFNVGIVFGNGWGLMGWRKTVRFVGTRCDIDIARYLFGFLQGHFRRSWNRRQNRRIRNREAFLKGMFLGLAAKLEKERNQAMAGNEAGLVLIGKAVEKRKQYIHEHWKTEDRDLEVDKSDAAASRYAGIVEGQRTELRRGMDGAMARREIGVGA